MAAIVYVVVINVLSSFFTVHAQQPASAAPTWIVPAPPEGEIYTQAVNIVFGETIHLSWSPGNGAPYTIDFVAGNDTLGPGYVKQLSAASSDGVEIGLGGSLLELYDGAGKFVKTLYCNIIEGSGLDSGSGSDDGGTDTNSGAPAGSSSRSSTATDNNGGSSGSGGGGQTDIGTVVGTVVGGMIGTIGTIVGAIITVRYVRRHG